MKPPKKETNPHALAAVDAAEREAYLTGLGFSGLFARNCVHLNTPPYERVMLMLASRGAAQIEVLFADVLE